MIHLEWYRIFLHTARQGNFTKAAKDMHLTQPSVSHAIKQLEEEMEVKLFHRMPKGVELTEEGAVLLDYVEQAFSILESGQRHVDGMKKLQRGEVRIGASDYLIKHHLLPYLNVYHKEYPGIHIRLSHGKTPELTERLLEGEIHCAIVHLPLEDPLLEVRMLAIQDYCFVAGAEKYGALKGRPIGREELAMLPLLLLSAGSSTRRFVEQWFAEQGIEVEADIELGSLDLLAEFAMLGYGIALINRSFVEAEIASGKLLELELAEPLPPRSIGFAVRRDLKLSLAAEDFVRLLIEGSSKNNASVY